MGAITPAGMRGTITTVSLRFADALAGHDAEGKRPEMKLQFHIRANAVSTA